MFVLTDYLLVLNELFTVRFELNIYIYIYIYIIKIHSCSIFISIYKVLLRAGQTGEACETFKKQRRFRDQGALYRKYFRFFFLVLKGKNSDNMLRYPNGVKPEDA